MEQSNRIVAVVPVYNNGRTVSTVVRDIARFVSDIIVVNDGSTDGTAAALAAINDIDVVSTEKNRGKGNALRCGFSRALGRGFTHAITLDADGQHRAGDLPLFLAKISESPETLWIGNRVLPAAGARQPHRSKFGGQFGAFWYRFNTGLDIADTQCGFRAYPLEATLALGCTSERFEYELDVLTRAAWNRIPVKQVDIHRFYQPREQRVSHFRPVRDFLRISAINAKAAMTRIFFPWRFIDVPGATLGEKILNLLMQELRAHHSPGRAATALGLGTCLAIMPIHGFQVLTALGLSFAFRLNRALCMIGVSISSAPFLPFWLAAGYFIGRFLVPAYAVAGIAVRLDAMAAKLPVADALEKFATTSIATVLIQWFLGSVVLALVVGIATVAIAYPAFSAYAKIRGRG